MLKRKEEVKDVVEETSEENVKKEEVEKIDNTNLKVVNSKIVDEEGFAVSDSEITDESEKTDLFVEVDGYRQKYIKAAKFSRYFNTGLMIVLLVLVILTWIFMSQIAQPWNIVLLVVAILAMVGLLVYNYLSKRHLNNKAAEYVSKYYEVTTKYMLNGEDFSLVTINPKGKVEQDFFVESRLYNGIKSTGSRNVASFNYKDHEMIFVDLAAQIQGTKRLEPIFVGKVLKFKTNIELPGRLIIQIKGNSKLTKPIDDIEGLEKVLDGSNYVAYSNLNKANKFLTKSITDLFSKYRLNNDLLDVIISVYSNAILIGLDYNDHVMQLPVDKKFSKKLVDNIKEALLNSIDIVENLYSKIKE